MATPARPRSRSSRSAVRARSRSAARRHPVSRRDVFTREAARRSTCRRDRRIAIARRSSAFEVAIGAAPAVGRLSGPPLPAGRAAELRPRRRQRGPRGDRDPRSRRSSQNASSPTRSSPRAATGRASRRTATTVGSGRPTTRRPTTTGSRRAMASRSSGCTRATPSSTSRSRRPTATWSSSTRATTRSRRRPGTNAYYLNFLAGDTKPVTQLNDPAYAWIVDDWAGRPIAIPLEPAPDPGRRAVRARRPGRTRVTGPIAPRRRRNVSRLASKKRDHPGPIGRLRDRGQLGDPGPGTGDDLLDDIRVLRRRRRAADPRPRRRPATCGPPSSVVKADWISFRLRDRAAIQAPAGISTVSWSVELGRPVGASSWPRRPAR